MAGVGVAVAGLEFVLAVVGLGSDAQTSAKLEEMDSKLDDIDAGIGTVSSQILQSAVSEARTARQQLDNFAVLDTSDPGVRERERDQIVDRADGALNDVLAQADARLSAGASYETVMETLGAVSFALGVRFKVGLELEAGLLGALGVREQVTTASDLFEAAEGLLRSAIYREQDNAVAALPPLPFPTLGLAPGYYQETWKSLNTGNSETFRIEQKFFEPNTVFLARLAIERGQARSEARDDLYREDLRDLKYLDVVGTTNQLERLASGENILGDSSGNRLEPGSFGNDLLVGLGGDDMLDGGRGNDALRGDSGNDHLDGGFGTDVLMGGPGNDFIDGGENFDIARFLGRKQDYEISGSTLNARIEGPEGIDVLANVESLLFDDGEFLLPEADPAREVSYEKMVAFLYGCAFDRDPDIGGLNYWIDQYESGMSIFQIAKFMTNEEGGEFEQLYGPIESLPADQYVRQLYLNTLDRVPDSGGFDYWVDAIVNKGVPREDLVFHFSKSQEYREANDDLVDTLFEAVPGTWEYVA
ncbi:DUF4214 domain-containing protein [Rhodovulum sp. 12E13]|uniref:DUF4214 domain-containing protein n=1 Tax=Rhodovulum sp. 12E13 TaxID=2203891 RepID=UPI000E1588F4|nr:DUF4214 domain-containing protein [Rhodovulum sp. 12E13]RDC74781.1 DUF4214 domain-containing protein [Rhodovulum sp. 12E13]